MVEGLSKELSNSRSKSITLSTTNQYIYYAYRNALGAATFTSSLGEIDFLLTTMTITNAEGFQESYRVYRSQYAVSGGFTITVS